MMDLKIYSSSYGYSALEIKSLLCEFAAARGKHNLDVWLDGCRFVGCSHTKEKGCAVLEAVRAGKLSASRHASYLRLYNELKDLREWSSK